jgi:hypothetical protein
MTDEIDIPASAFDPKPWWDKRPTDERIQEIMGFIQRTNKPYLWPGQTYDKPHPDSIPDYLAEFHLPSSKPLTPCPCCTPRHAKYRHGMIAYFPQERVIRIMGHDCFRSINSERHTEALKKYHGDLQRKKDIAYLLGNLGKVPELTTIITHAVPIGHALDNLRNRACQVFKEVLRIDLYDQIRTGELKYNTSRMQFFPISQGEEEEKEIHSIETYGRISGQDMLNTRFMRLGNRLDQALIVLDRLDFGPDFQKITAEMTDRDRRDTARMLGRCFDTANKVFTAIEELRQFTSTTTIATLNGWARQEGAPVRMHVAFDGKNLYVGKEQDNYRRIEIEPGYALTLKTLPKLGTPNSAAA